MAFLSKSCIYGIRAAIYCSFNKNGKYIPIDEISRELNIPGDYLTKILQKLTKKNIMESLRGAKGGVKLKNNKKVSLLDIVNAIDGDSLFSNCFLNLEGCSEKNPCPMHQHWKNYRTEIKKFLKRGTLSYFAGNNLFKRI